MEGSGHSYNLRSNKMASVSLTQEQFRELMDRLAIGNAQHVQNPPAVAHSGNFAKCNSRFDGSSDTDVKAFIDAIEIFKSCTDISDVNALKGLPMLLDGFAASWYQGVKSTLTTWQEAIDLLRSTFGPAKPAYRVYRELFAREQDSRTKSDIFICKARSILAQLPPGTLAEEIQLDMVYGLLHRKIREKVPRDKVASFSELLTHARLAEETFDVSSEPTAYNDSGQSKNAVRFVNTLDTHLTNVVSE